MTPGPICRVLGWAVLALVLLTAGCASDGGATVQSTGSVAAPTDQAVVRTSDGAVRGVVAADHRLFAGIPYAAPPVGPLRWRPPAPVAAWPGERDATHPGRWCLQEAGADPEFGRQTDEDCLTLNVWTPPASGERRPVMVWIHGGAFVNGAGSIYDARGLAARGGMVVVTLNYRLGAMGFLADPALGSAGESGNYGLADQQAALRWVRDNIAAFGGDPDRVTLAGQSAGGMSVCDHLVAPGSAGLFWAAIIQSGPCQAQVDLPTAQRRSIDYSAEIGCRDRAIAAQCLRALPAAKFRKPLWYASFGGDKMSGPTVGSASLPVDPVTAFADGGAARVPVMIGTNHDEFTFVVALRALRTGEQVTAENYPQQMAEAFGADAEAVARHYRLDRYDDPALALAAAGTDGVFACPAARWAAHLATTRPVYAYEFNDRDAPAPESLRTLPFPVGASHSLELRYLFDVGGAPPLTPAQRDLSDQMIAYWARFAATGAPSVDNQPEWPAGGRLSLAPHAVQVMTDFDDSHQCAFWAGLR